MNNKILIGLLVVLMMTGCSQKLPHYLYENNKNTNQTLEPEKSLCNDVTVVLPLGITVLTQEQINKLNNTAKLYGDLLQYTSDNEANLTEQLREVRNGTKDRIIDAILQEKVNRLHDDLTNNYTGEEVMIFGLDRILNDVYNIDDVLNPKNISKVDIVI